MVHLGQFLRTWSFRSHSVTRQLSFYRQKLVKNAKIQKFKCAILSNFQTMWHLYILKNMTRKELLSNSYFSIDFEVVKRISNYLLKSSGISVCEDFPCVKWAEVDWCWCNQGVAASVCATDDFFWGFTTWLSMSSKWIMSWLCLPGACQLVSW